MPACVRAGNRALHNPGGPGRHRPDHGGAIDRYARSAHAQLGSCLCGGSGSLSLDGDHTAHLQPHLWPRQADRPAARVMSEVRPRMRAGSDPFKLAGRLVGFMAAAVAIFMILPAFIVMPVSFSDSSILMFPPTIWSLRWYRAFFSIPEWRSSV